MTNTQTTTPAIIEARQDLPADQINLASEELAQRFVRYIDRPGATEQNYLANLRSFARWMKAEQIRQPVREDIARYRDYLLQDHKPGTVKLYLQAVKRFFAWLASEGLYRNVADNIHPPKITETHKKDSLTPAEVLTIEESIKAEAETRTQAAEESAKDTAGRIQRSDEQGKRLFALYVLAVNAGLRTVELSRANVKDLQRRGTSCWLFIQGKGHSEADQRKPIAPEVYDAIQDYLQSRTDAKTPNSPLFVSTGNRSGGQRIAETTISKMLKQAMRAAGYDSERLTAHSLRHTAGQAVLEMTGNNIYTTQLYMRHTSPKTTELYLDNQKAAQDESIACELYARYHAAAVC